MLKAENVDTLCRNVLILIVWIETPRRYFYSGISRFIFAFEIFAALRYDSRTCQLFIAHTKRKQQQKMCIYLIFFLFFVCCHSYSYNIFNWDIFRAHLFAQISNIRQNIYLFYSFSRKMAISFILHTECFFFLCILF